LLPTGIAATLVVVAAGGYAVWKKGTSPPAAELASKAVPLTTLAGVVRHPTFSADGNQVAFSWNGPKEDNTDIYVQQIGAGTPHRLTSDPGTDISPVWSPDGRAIAFLRILRDGRQELRLVPPVNGPERKVADIKPRGFLREVTLDWCRDSTCIILTDHSAPDPGKPDVLFVVSVDSGEKRQLTSGPDTGLADTDPAVSPDGKWLVFRRDTAPFSGRLHVVPLGSGMTLAGEPRPITSFLLSAYWPRWISNDEILFSAKGALWRTRIAPGSEPARVAFAGEDGVTPAVSPAVAGRPARLAYVRSYRDTNVWRLETGGVGMPANGAPVRAIGSTRRDALAQLSPDGRSIVFISDRSGESELWISDVDGGNAVQLTSLGATPGFPRWSPDGSLVAFHSNTEEGPAGDVFVVPSGGGKPRKMTSDAASDTFATFSRDGRWIYFCSRREGSNAIWKLPVTGGAPTRVTPKTAIFALEGTDGKNIYFVEGSTLAVAGALWRQPLGQGAPEKLVDGVMPLAFDVLDRGIYYLGDVAGGSVLFYDFATRQSIVVAKSVAPSNASASLSVSADGRTILFTRIDTRVDDLMLVDKFR
jgi:Tol biopolymer transport system component